MMSHLAKQITYETYRSPFELDAWGTLGDGAERGESNTSPEQSVDSVHIN